MIDYSPDTVGSCNTLLLTKEIKLYKLFIQINVYVCCIHATAYFLLWWYVSLYFISCIEIRLEFRFEFELKEFNFYKIWIKEKLFPILS
jgi:hypothetical protein